MADKNGFYPRETIADLFCITPRHLDRLVQQKILPRVAKGLFDLGATTQAWSRYLLGRINGLNPADADELERRILEAQAREREARASMVELNLAVMQGRLHEAEHVKKISTDMLVACRSRLLAVPSKAAGTVSRMTSEAEISSFLRSLVYEALEELSEYDPKKYNELNEKYVPPDIEDDVVIDEEEPPEDDSTDKENA